MVIVFIVLNAKHNRYLTTKGVVLRSSILKKVVFIQWENVTKVEVENIEGPYRRIFFI